MGFTLVTVSHTYQDEETNVPSVGEVVVQYSAPLTNAGSTRSESAITVPLVNGVFSAQLPATDDPATTPLGATVTFVERIRGFPIRYIASALHAASAPSIDLYALLRLDAGLAITDYPAPPTAGAGSFLAQQLVPAQVWTVVHNLGRNPFVQAFDTQSRALHCQVAYTSLNALTLTFPLAVAGTATCS